MIASTSSRFMSFGTVALKAKGERLFDRDVGEKRRAQIIRKEANNGVPTMAYGNPMPPEPQMPAPKLGAGHFKLESCPSRSGSCSPGHDQGEAPSPSHPTSINLLTRRRCPRLINEEFSHGHVKSFCDRSQNA